MTNQDIYEFEDGVIKSPCITALALLLLALLEEWAIFNCHTSDFFAIKAS